MSIEYYIAGFEWEQGSNHLPNGDMEANSYWSSSGGQSSLWYSTSYYYLQNRSLGFNVAPTTSGGESNRFYHQSPISVLYPGSKYQIDISYLHISGASGIYGEVLTSDASTAIVSFMVGPGGNSWQEFKHAFSVPTTVNNPILSFGLNSYAGSTEISSSLVLTNFTTWSYSDPRSWLVITQNRVTLKQRGGWGSSVYLTRQTSFWQNTIYFKIEVNSYGQYFGGENEILRLISYDLRASTYLLNLNWLFYYNCLKLECEANESQTASHGLPYQRYCSLKINMNSSEAKLDIYTDSAMQSLDTTLTVVNSQMIYGIEGETILSNYNCPYEYFEAAIENYGYMESQVTVSLANKQTYYIDNVYFGTYRGWEDIGVLQIFPEWDYRAETIQNRSDHRTRGGKLYSYKWGSYKKFSIPLEYVQNSKAAIINSWWASDALIHFKIYSGGMWETNTCYIMNNNAPFSQRQKPYRDYMKGNLELETF